MAIFNFLPLEPLHWGKIVPTSVSRARAIQNGSGEPEWIKQRSSKSRRLNPLTPPNDPQRQTLSRVKKRKTLKPRGKLSPEANSRIRHSNNKVKTISSAFPLWIPFHSANHRKNHNAPFGPLAPRPWRRRRRRARAQRAPPPARAKRAPPAPPRVPRAAGSHPTQGVSISTALAKAALRINCAASKLRCEKVTLKPIKGRR